MATKQNCCPDLSQEDPADPFEDFTRWFRGIVTRVRPSIIVAVARGAVRFLQLHYHDSLPEGVRFLCHHALPFLKDDVLAGSLALVFDDSVVYGSTMDRVTRYLEGRGAVVFCAAYALDRTSFLGEVEPGVVGTAPPSKFARLPVTVKHRLWPDKMRRHHAALVQSILQTPLHYNLDFPTFRLGFPPLRPCDSPNILHLLRRTGMFRRVEDVSSSFSADKGVYRCTGLIPGECLECLLSTGVVFRPYAKVRITWAPHLGHLSITPIVQLSVTDSTSHDSIDFQVKWLADAWQGLCFPHSKSDEAYHQCLFRLLTAFAGTVLGTAISQKIWECLCGSLAVQSVDILSEDMAIVLGDRNARALIDLWRSLQERPLQADQRRGDKGLPASDELPNAPELRNKLVRFFRSYPAFQPSANDPAYASVGKVLLGVHAVTDSEEARRTTPGAQRLETGLSYEGISHLLQNITGAPIDPEELSLAIDTCVDHGLAVPKIVRESGAWFRVFYSGENRHAHDPLQLEGALNEAARRFRKKGRHRSLSVFEFQKLAVALKDIVPWLPLSTLPFRFGFTATIGHEQLVKRLTDGPLAPFRKVTEEGRQVLLPVDGYVCPVRRTWDPQENRDFFDAFDYTATAITKLPKDVAGDALLLLSSCRTHRHTYNAVAFEAHTWAATQDFGLTGDEHYVFGRYLVGIAQLVPDQLYAAREFLTSLYWWVRYVSEALKKHRIFHRDYQVALNALKKAFRKQGPAGERWWAFLEGRRLLDPGSDPEIADRFSLLNPLLRQMTRLTVFTVKTMLESGLILEQSMEDEFARHGVSMRFSEFDWLTGGQRGMAAKEYDAEISSGQLPGKSLFKALLPTDAIPRGGDAAKAAGAALCAARDCFLEITGVLVDYCKRYDVVEGDFPFSPLKTEHTLFDGSVETRRSNVLLLTMDIVKGTNAEQTNRMKDEIRAVLLGFRDQGLVFGDTGDDAFVACADDPLLLWNAADLIRIRGQDLIIPGEAFGGTRKGIYCGTVSVIQKPDGEVLIRDARIPNSIPPAMYMLEGLKDSCFSSEQNSLLIIEERVALGRCVTALNLDITALPQITVTGKHFAGPCRVARLGHR